jgi:hypothetical protein
VDGFVSAPGCLLARSRLWLLIAPMILAACSVVAPSTPADLSPASTGEAPSPGTANITLTVSTPSGTPADAQVALVLVDEVSGLPFNTQEVSMQRQTDGRWQAVVNRPLDSVVHYRYALRGSINADEVTSRGAAIRYRTLWLPGTIAVDEQIAAWSGSTYSGPTGRIVGTVVDSVSGAPLHEVIVSAAGVSTFTDGQGDFRLDGLEPGLHTLTAVSPDGSTVPFQQGAVIAAESATPVRLTLQPAAPVQVTFEVEIPADTAGGMPLRMAGNLRQFGARFADIPGDTGGAASGMPTLVQVDSSHYILIADLFSGADFHYKYTLGDGLWNAERDSGGFLVTRQLIVPETDTVVRDVVEGWTRPGQGPVTFNVRLPDTNPSDVVVGLQFMPSDGFQPLPMWQSSENTWSYVLYGPLDSQQPMLYRYCRMADCARVFPGGTGETAAQPRQLTPSADPSEVNDDVTSWVWQLGPSPLPDMPTSQIEPRPGFEAGVELQPDPDPNSIALTDGALNEIAGGGANAVTLVPSWALGLPNQPPIMTFDPGDAPFASEIEEEMTVARNLGLEVNLRPRLAAPGGDIDKWWQDSARDAPWWNAWFEGYRSFLLTYARVAAEGGASKIVIGGPDVAPAFPRGVLQDGSLAGAPPDAETRWREIIDEVRGVFSGSIALELGLSDTLQSPPPFVDAVDQIHIYWHPSIDTQDGASLDALRAEAGRWMDEAVIGEPLLADKQLVLSVEYPSVAGGNAGCIRDPGGGCYPVSALALGADPDPSLSLDLDSQAQAYDAVLMEAFSRSQFGGLYARGYNPSVPLQDVSASVRGKPAQAVLWYWFSRITGKVAP